MSLEKYPTNFLFACLLYAVIFLMAFSYFVVPSLSFGYSGADLYLILASIFLPLVLIVLYHFTPRIHFLWGKEKLLRAIITALIIIDFLIVMMFMILLIG